MVQSANEHNFGPNFMSKFSGNIETQARTAGLTSSVIFTTVKLLIDFGLVGLTNTDAGVFNGEFYDTNFLFGAHRDGARLGVFDGVCDKVL